MHKLIRNITLLLFFIFEAFLIAGCNPDPVETDLLIPVEFSNIPSHMIMTGFHTDKIEIRVKADPRLIEKIKSNNISYPVDLYTDLEFDPAGDSNSIETGSYLIPVERKRVPVNPNIRILNITPPYLSVQLETKISKSFQIAVQYSGTPPEGYIVLEAAATPSIVELTGAQSQISRIETLKTKPIDLSLAKESFKKEIPLDLDAHGKIIASSPIIVVSIPVRQQIVSLTVSNINIDVLNTNLSARVEPSTISIKLKGPYETINNRIILNQISSFINLKGIAPGVYTRYATIDVPVGLMMTDASPKVFTVKLE